MSSCRDTIPGFCPTCGDILPLLKDKGGVKCYSCLSEWGPSVFKDTEVEYVIHFNNIEAYETKDTEEKAADEGPTVDRKCPKCNNNKMTYAAIQLRSADEGQTVFYTCTKCRYKESENS